MSMATSYAQRAHEENWLPVLELAIEEVFEIMLGCKVKPTRDSEVMVKGEFTAMIGLAGALCGILTICCSAETARQVAQGMLGDTVDCEDQVSDALGEVCNMVAGNFESGVAQMKATSVAAFDRIAGLLRPRGYRLRIEGHTDNAPIHTLQFPSNWELSTARATEIVRLLIIRDGFAPDRLSAAGYAEYHPVASNRSIEGRAMNRRVDIVILGKAQEQPALTTSEGGTAIATPAAAAAAKPSPAVALKPTGLGRAGAGLQN